MIGRRLSRVGRVDPPARAMTPSYDRPPKAQLRLMTHENETVRAPLAGDPFDSQSEWIDALRSLKESPVVRFKRRRVVEASVEEKAESPAEAQQGATAARSARTFQVPAPIHEPVDRTDGLDSTAAYAVATIGRAPTLAPQKHRRRRDPLQAPGAVTRIVFDQTPRAPSPADTRGDGSRQDDGFGVSARALSRYGEVLRAIERVHRTLAEALSASTFRLDA